LARLAFTARLLPPQVTGGLERWSDVTRTTLSLQHSVTDLGNRGGRANQIPYLLRLRHRIRKSRTEVDGIDASDASLAAMVTGHGVPAWARIHGLDFLARTPGYQSYVRRFVPRFEAVVANSSATRDLFCRRFDFPPAQVSVIHPVPYIAPLERKTRPSKTAVFVGRLVPRKGIVEFVERVWPHVSHEVPEAKLKVIGDGPERSRLVQAVAKSGVGNSVVLCGAAGEDVKREHLADARVGIMFNQGRKGDWEGFGMVAAENASIGMPTVGTDIEGLRDSIVDGVTGVRVMAGDDEAFAMATIHHLTTDSPMDASRMRQEAVNRWGQDRFAQQYLAFVESMLG
jgi:glycosyltransferase involved in cell wall biosynthesis